MQPLDAMRGGPSHFKSSGLPCGVAFPAFQGPVYKDRVHPEAAVPQLGYVRHTRHSSQHLTSIWSPSTHTCKTQNHCRTHKYKSLPIIWGGIVSWYKSLRCTFVVMRFFLSFILSWTVSFLLFRRPIIFSSLRVSTKTQRTISAWKLLLLLSAEILHK